MSRCTRTTNLEIHHKNRDAGANMANAQVLCQECHSATSTYGVPGKSPEPFDEVMKEAALKRAGYRCQCESSSGCH
jgi:5-methylcytosine-specific restriction endonuclease McrA